MQNVRRNKFLILLAFLVLFATAVSLAACGSSRGASSSNKNPTTLVGEWSQVNASSDGWMTASISGSSIRVNLRGRDSNSVFWLGSFNTSHKPCGKFNVVSLGDRDAMRWEIMASSEKQKTFNYDSGILSFEFSAMGSSATVHMVKNEKSKAKVWATPKQKSKASKSYPTPKPTIKKTASKPTPVKK